MCYVKGIALKLLITASSGIVWFDSFLKQLHMHEKLMSWTSEPKLSTLNRSALAEVMVAE